MFFIVGIPFQMWFGSGFAATTFEIIFYNQKMEYTTTIALGQTLIDGDEAENNKVIAQAMQLRPGQMISYCLGSYGGRAEGLVYDDTKITRAVNAVPTLAIFGSGNSRWILRLRSPPITIISQLVGWTIICEGSTFVFDSHREVKEYPTVLEACKGEYNSAREYYLEQELEATKKRLARLEAIVEQMYWAPGGLGAQAAEDSFNTLRGQVSPGPKALNEE